MQKYFQPRLHSIAIAAQRRGGLLSNIGNGLNLLSYNPSGTNAKRISPFINKAASFLRRFIVALTGGLSLVVPMLIMRINETTTKSLVTTSVAVVLFAIIVSLGFKASAAETLGITAAYAAVLVVFVGTSSNA